jgi:hypothetical protein
MAGPVDSGGKMTKSYNLIALFVLLATLLSACSAPPLRIQSDVVPPGSLRIAQVMYITKRAEVVNSDMYKGIIDSGITDSELIDGSVVVARIYCCGGMSNELSSEFVERRMLYVPKSVKVALGDFVEVKVGRPPEKGDGGLLNTVTRVVAGQGENPEGCWWEPKNPKLWLRVPYCNWMPKEGWVNQGGLSPAWYKPGQEK